MRLSVRMSPAARQEDLVGQISSLNIISTTGPGRGGARSCETLCLSHLTGSDAANRLDGGTSHVIVIPAIKLINGERPVRALRTKHAALDTGVSRAARTAFTYSVAPS